MAQAMVPISQLRYAKEDVFPLDACEILDLILGDHRPEEPFTYTFRVGSPYDPGTPEFTAWREDAAHHLRMQVADKEAVERLITLLDQHNWDVSFFVDSF